MGSVNKEYQIFLDRISFIFGYGFTHTLVSLSNSRVVRNNVWMSLLGIVCWRRRHISSSRCYVVRAGRFQKRSSGYQPQYWDRWYLFATARYAQADEYVRVDGLGDCAAEGRKQRTEERNQPQTKAGDISSEAERRRIENKDKAKRRKSKAKKHKIKINRTVTLSLARSKLPPDVKFKGYDTVVVQDLAIKTNNILFRKEVFYSPSERQSYRAELPFCKLKRFSVFGVESISVSVSPFAIDILEKVTCMLVISSTAASVSSNLKLPLMLAISILVIAELPEFSSVFK